MRRIGIPIKNAKLIKGNKIETIDTGARHPVVKKRRQRTRNKVTGVKPAK